jgi:hypothetical protein
VIENALSVLDFSVHAAAEPTDTTPGAGAVVVNTHNAGSLFVAKIPRIDGVDSQEVFETVLSHVARSTKTGVLRSAENYVALVITDASASALKIFMDDVVRNKVSDDIRVGRVRYDAGKRDKHIPDYTPAFEDADAAFEFPGYVYAAIPNSTLLWRLFRLLETEKSGLLGGASVRYGAGIATGSHYILVKSVIKGKPQVKASDLPRIEAGVAAAKDELHKIVTNLNKVLGSFQIFHATAAYKLGEAL